MRRLFLFAGYDGQGLVGPALEYYVKELSRHGDIVFVMDNGCERRELEKLGKYVLHSMAERHEEYDFGSYKRAFAWASEHLELETYDFCYLVNDSVYGPLFNPGDCLEKMEHAGTDAFSLVLNPHRRHPHLQSWFIGMRPAVFLSAEFRSFMAGVARQKDKESVCILYETGFTALLDSSGFSYDGLYRIKGRRIYNDVGNLCEQGLPFFKKVAFTRHGGSLGRQVAGIMRRMDPELRKAVVEDAERLYGKDYLAWFLSGSSLGMIWRQMKYLSGKLARR